MNTKYIKVPVSERLPEKNKCVKVVDQSDNIYDGFVTDKDVWQVYTQFEYGRIEYWLEEVPDREEEMKEDLIRNLKKTVEALELIGSITGEEMPLTIEDAKRIINKYS